MSKAASWLQESWASVGYPVALSALVHGDLDRWLTALDRLPVASAKHFTLDATVGCSGPLGTIGTTQLRSSLAELRPWRKGPFNLFGVPIESEWRSDLKWQRIQGVLDLSGKRVLDVGCGNGYYGWRMLDAGANRVVGVDPTTLFVMQHAAVGSYLDQACEFPNVVLPLKLEELSDAALAGAALADLTFDVAFSMGVLYHRRDPTAHLRHLAARLDPGGQLVLETLVAKNSFVPKQRYARMRNVWAILSEAELFEVLLEAGFEHARCVNVSLTRSREQRQTADMTFDSLDTALDLANPLQTIEGYPAPVRAFIIATRR